MRPQRLANGQENHGGERHSILWKHLLPPGIYIRHMGGTSFGECVSTFGRARDGPLSKYPMITFCLFADGSISFFFSNHLHCHSSCRLEPFLSNISRESRMACIKHHLRLLRSYLLGGGSLRVQYPAVVVQSLPISRATQTGIESEHSKARSSGL